MLVKKKKIQKNEKEITIRGENVWKRKTWRQNIAAMSHIPTFLSYSSMNCNHYAAKGAAALQRRDWREEQDSRKGNKWRHLSHHHVCSMFFWNGQCDFVNRRFVHFSFLFGVFSLPKKKKKQLRQLCSHFFTAGIRVEKHTKHSRH